MELVDVTVHYLEMFSPLAPLRSGPIRWPDGSSRLITDRAVLPLALQRRWQGLQLAESPKDVG